MPKMFTSVKQLARIAYEIDLFSDGKDDGHDCGRETERDGDRAFP